MNESAAAACVCLFLTQFQLALSVLLSRLLSLSKRTTTLLSVWLLSFGLDQIGWRRRRCFCLSFQMDF